MIGSRFQVSENVSMYKGRLEHGCPLRGREKTATVKRSVRPSAGLRYFVEVNVQSPQSESSHLRTSVERSELEGQRAGSRELLCQFDHTLTVCNDLRYIHLK